MPSFFAPSLISPALQNIQSDGSWYVLSVLRLKTTNAFPFLFSISNVSPEVMELFVSHAVHHRIKKHESKNIYLF